ncbi:MAG: hypothetical protein WC757_00035 [Candidatus Paceibacterota bacterium]|jgi:hypothetical protein
MISLITNALLIALALALLAVFILGAWRHTVAATLGGPLAAADPAAKRRRYLVLAGKVLWHLLAMTVLFLAHSLQLFLIAADKEQDVEEKIEHGGATWRRDCFGNWHSFDADENSHPPQY